MVSSMLERDIDWNTYDQYAMGVVQNYPVCRDLLKSPALRRLHDISFLGGMDLFSQEFEAVATRQFSRLAHSVGVAYLASRLMRRAGADEKVAGTVVAAALLHDVGHGAFSHSIEPYFIRKFGLNHHRVTKRLVCGDILAGLGVREILHDHQICPKDVFDTMDGVGLCAEFFKGPINIDTLDGIPRAANGFDIRRPNAKPDYVAQVFELSKASEALGDLFWKTKADVYGRYILQPHWAVYDAALVTVLELADAKVSVEDFLLTDGQFRAKFAKELVKTRDRLRRDRRGVEWLADRVIKMRGMRHFVIDERVKIGAIEDLALRYRERRERYEPD